MNEINSELLQFFKEQKKQYNFLLHRTKCKQDAINIMENGLYFEEQLSKVVDQVSEVSELSLKGNRMFFQSYGSYIMIIAVPKNIEQDYEQIVNPVSQQQLKTVFKTEYFEFDDMYNLSPSYIMAYNIEFGKKLNFNRKFFENKMKISA